MKYIYFYQTIIGKIGIAEDITAISNVYLKEQAVSNDYEIKETALLKEASKQLSDYLAGARKTFDIPLSQNGTEFQKRVWKLLLEIPYGETRSYGEIAKNIDNPKASRAVGMANNKNPIPIFIPCHRVIGASGKLIGYGGGLELKEYLLNLEKQNSNA